MLAQTTSKLLLLAAKRTVHPFLSMTATVLPQLQTVEAELIAQEEALTAQLTELREKLNSLRTVLPMFEGEGGLPKEVAISPVEEPVEKTEPETVDNSPEDKPEKKRSSKGKKAAATTAKQKKPATKKKDGRAASWQKYARPGVKNQSMPDAVRLILETQPKNDFKIADVMDVLFEENMPKAQYLKARNRISNVLSGGVRAGDWFKGDRGTYRMTKA